MDGKTESSDDFDVEEALGWAEFCGWSALVMTPIIWWLQGPSVSSDQYVVRCSLIVISCVVAVGLRIRNVMKRKKAS